MIYTTRQTDIPEGQGGVFGFRFYLHIMPASDSETQSN